eukprot:2086781-Amphidinium_carterae.1
MVIVMALVAPRWLQSVQDLPSLEVHGDERAKPQASTSEELQVTGPGEPPASNIGASMKHSTDLQLSELRRTSQNSLVVALRILGNTAIRKRMVMMVLLARPSEEQHQQAVTMRKTKGGCLAYNISLSTSAWQQTLRDMLSVLLERGFFERVGFEMQATYDPASVEGADDLMLARTGAEIAQQQAKRMIEVGLFSSAKPPGMFAALLSPDELVRNGALERCRVLWESLCRYE